MHSAGVVFLVAFLVIAQHIYIYVLLSCVVGYYHSTATVTVTGTISKFKSFESSRQRQPDCCVGFPVRHALYNRMCSYVYQNNDARRSTDRRSDTGNRSGQLSCGTRHIGSSSFWHPYRLPCPCHPPRWRRRLLVWKCLDQSPM